MRPLAPFFTLGLALLVALATACTKPSPPTLVPERVRITGITASAIDLDVTVQVTNPNAIDLVARSLTAHVVLGQHFDVGTVDIPVTTVLPANQTTKLDVPLSVKLTDLPSLTRLALANTAIPYTVDGTVGLGGDLLHVELPYRLSDSVPRDQLARAVVTAMPGLGNLIH